MINKIFKSDNSVIGICEILMREDSRIKKGDTDSTARIIDRVSGGFTDDGISIIHKNLFLF